MGIKVCVPTMPNRRHDWSLSEKRRGRVILDPPNLFHEYQIQIEKIVFSQGKPGLVHLFAISLCKSQSKLSLVSS